MEASRSANPLQTKIGQFRPPAAPLVTHSPFLSVWDVGDSLTDKFARHWTEAQNAITGLIRIDDVCYRFAGPDQHGTPAMEQVSLEVGATRTTYVFQEAGIQLTLEFLSPLLMDDLEVLARPLSYLTFVVRAIDGQAHDVSLYLDLTAEWCVNGTGEMVFASRHRIEGLETMALRSVDQPVLKRKGDRVRVDWGSLVLATQKLVTTESAIGGHTRLRRGFIAEGLLPLSDDMRFPRAASDDWPVLALLMPMGLVGTDETSRMAMVAYDEEFAVEYLHRKLPPLWRAGGDQIDTLLSKGLREYPSLRRRCSEFDGRLWAELEARGGEDYAQLAVLAYRQCLAAHGLVQDVDGTLMMFSKENDSNGCIGTVDVTYPGSPLFLYLNPDLLKAQLEPVLRYAQLPRWRFPFAPHDLGTYPLANGQVYGGGERDEHDQMPVEECGNMLILVAALCIREGSAAFAAPYLDVLTEWAEYLVQCGLDPENQLCTDDFAGHMAHNANLSIKAIMGIGAFAEVCRLIGQFDDADRLRAVAQSMVGQWLELADDGDHTRLAFDRPGSWSQKYNLVWDDILGLGLFPKELARKEIAFYLKQMNRYGLPLDSRRDYTKLDWCVWTATLAEKQKDFDAIVQPLLRFCQETPDRVPLCDWFDTVTAKQMSFQARSVVGGVFLPML